MAALALVGIVVFIVLIGIAAKAMRQGYEKTLRQLGQPFGWSYERTMGRGLQSAIGVGHALRGWIDGRPFELIVAPEGRNKYLSERWAITLVGQLPGGFAAGKNGLLRGTSEGMTRVMSGDAEFDKKVLCEGVDPAQAWLVLQAEARKAALRELAALDAVIFGNQVVFSKVGFDASVAKLEARLARLRAIAGAIDPVQPGVQQMPMPMPMPTPR